MDEGKIIIEITKVKSNILWYRTKIGQRYVVYNKDTKETTYSVKTEGEVSRIVYKEDARVIRYW